MNIVTINVYKEDTIKWKGEEVQTWEIHAKDNPHLLDNKNWWIDMKGKIVKQSTSTELYKVIYQEMYMTCNATGAAIGVIPYKSNEDDQRRNTTTGTR